MESGRFISYNYPVLAWIRVMILGYCFGALYKKDVDSTFRKKWLVRLGFGSLILFVIIRLINYYGDLVPWEAQKDSIYTFLSFMNVTKYPPSLAFVLITLGPGMLFLFAIEKTKNKITDFILVYGRVPFFYYLLHILFNHIAAIVGLMITGGDWTMMILTNEVFEEGSILTYGYPLRVVYLVWVGIVLSLNHLSKW